MGSVDYWPLAIIPKQTRETTPATTARFPRASPRGPPRWAVRSRGAALPSPRGQAVRLAAEAALVT